jgi:ketosteroid isomerase-like protein
VDLVRALVSNAEVDWAAVVRDDELWNATAQGASALFDDSVSCALVGVTETRLRGLEGLRRIWLDWVEPWSTYRTSEDEIVDVGDGRVLYLGRDFGGGPDGREVELLSSAIWTVNDGRVTEVVFYASRDDAFAAARLPRGSTGARGPKPAA